VDTIPALVPNGKSPTVQLVSIKHPSGNLSHQLDHRSLPGWHTHLWARCCTHCMNRASTSKVH
jgi:hypothetical protein